MGRSTWRRSLERRPAQARGKKPQPASLCHMGAPKRERDESDWKRYGQTGACFRVTRSRNRGHHISQRRDFANYLRENSTVKGYRSQAACTGLPALPMQMRLVLFGRARHSVRAVFSMEIHDSRENTATAFRLPPTISVRLCLITRIDRGELRLNHLADKLAKSSCGLEACVTTTDHSLPINRLRFAAWQADHVSVRNDARHLRSTNAIRIAGLTDPLLC